MSRYSVLNRFKICVNPSGSSPRFILISRCALARYSRPSRLSKPIIGSATICISSVSSNVKFRDRKSGSQAVKICRTSSAIGEVSDCKSVSSVSANRIAAIAQSCISTRAISVCSVAPKLSLALFFAASQVFSPVLSRLSNAMICGSVAAFSVRVITNARCSAVTLNSRRCGRGAYFLPFRFSSASISFKCSKSACTSLNWALYSSLIR